MSKAQRRRSEGTAMTPQPAHHPFQRKSNHGPRYPRASLHNLPLRAPPVAELFREAVWTFRLTALAAAPHVTDAKQQKAASRIFTHLSSHTRSSSAA